MGTKGRMYTVSRQQIDGNERWDRMGGGGQQNRNERKGKDGGTEGPRDGGTEGPRDRGTEVRRVTTCKSMCSMPPFRKTDSS